MSNVKTLSVILLCLSSALCEEVLVSEKASQHKRRLPDNFQQTKWTTTTVRPDEVYIEPIGDIKDLCIKMIERYQYGEGGYMWRPYNSRFYGELRWKKKYSRDVNVDNEIRF